MTSARVNRRRVLGSAFETDFIDTPGRSYDISPDGKRLLVVKRAEEAARNRINLVVNWTSLLEQ